MAEFHPVSDIAGDLDPGGPVRAIFGSRKGVVGYSENADRRQWLHQFSFALDPGPHRRTPTPALGNCPAAMDISPADALLVLVAGAVSSEMAQVGLAVLCCRWGLEKAAATQKENHTAADSKNSNGVAQNKREV